MTRSLDDLQSTIETALAMVGLDSDTVQRSPNSTIQPRRRADTGGKRAFQMLSELAKVRGTSMLELHETIGEGGMGIVRLGTQRAMGRSVAVKTLKPEHRKTESTLKLLREAWVTGSLEHPNVVPVYDIALEEDGSPQIILKRIEGDEWAELMHDARAVKKKFGANDLLEWNLRILMQVCHAVRFAHSRGILHRDLKPENVMIGAFGEVYVVDWGIAVALKDDGSGRLPLASQSTQLAGTPVYMAPEMLGGKTSRLSEKTDVYLLGSILYEIVSGQPPHQAEVFMEMVAMIVESMPPIPDDVAPEMVRMIRRATHADPDGRFENAEQVRFAVQGFLQHREAMRLADVANERLRELVALLKESGESDEPDPALGEPIYNLFGECRFGFRQAIKAWPENEVAHLGYAKTIVAMVEYELSHGQANQARTLLSNLEDIPEALLERVDAAQRAQAVEDARLKRIADDVDPTQGRRTRSFVASLVGGVWTVCPLAFHVYFIVNDGQAVWYAALIFSVVMLAFIVGLSIWARESMMRTAINRRVAFAAVTVMTSQALSIVVGWMTDRDPLATLHEQFLVWAAMAAFSTFSIDRRLIGATIGYVAGYLVIAFVGLSSTFLAMSICNGILLVSATLMWAKPLEDMHAVRDRVRKRRVERRIARAAQSK